MRGTRYGDFSRAAFDHRRDYRSVLMQQGRVQVDADWNEQGALQAHGLRVALADLFGESCAPASAPGYGLQPWRAIELDGTDRLRVREAGALTPRHGAEHTLELWLAWAGGGCVLVDCREADARQIYGVEIDAGGMLALTLRVERADRVETTARFDAAVPLPVETPVHLAIVIGRDFAAAYVDGLQVLHGRHERICFVERPSIVVGGPDDDPTARNGFVGLISGLRAWSAARSPAELARASTGGPVVTDEPALRAAWFFGEDDGPVSTDAVAGLTCRIDGDRPARRRLHDLLIEPGRFYVDGVLCELHEAQLYSRQPGLASAALPRSGQHLAYLEVWEESVSATEDPRLLEVALGGLDTSVRTRIASCVRLVRAPDSLDPYDRPGLERALAQRARGGQLAAEHLGDYAPGNYLYRVEIHDTGQLDHRSGERDDLDLVPVDLQAGWLVLETVWDEPGAGAGGFEIEVVVHDPNGTAVVRRHTVDDVRGSDGGTRLRLSSDPSELERAEVLGIRRAPRTPTFKWSRDNGASLFAVAASARGTLVVDVLPALGAVEWLSPGDVVEPLAAEGSLDRPANPLLQVVESSEEEGRVTIDAPLPGGIAYLRRWDHEPRTESMTLRAGGAQLPVRPGWIDLEDGIRVRFEEGDFRRGDYWWIVSRQDLRSIEWPHEHGHPVAQPPSGVERLSVPLALLRLDHRARIHDLRRIAPGLAREG